MQLLPNLAGTGRRLAEDGCALMDPPGSRGSHLHLQVLLPCGSQHRATEGSWLSPVTTWCIPCASSRAKIQSCSRAMLAEPAGLGGGSRSASALRRPWQGEFGGSQNRDGVDRPGVRVGGAGVGEREAGQCLDRALTEFLPFLREPSSSPHPRVRRSRGRLLSITAQGVWEGARRSRLCRIMGTSQPAGLGLGI